MGIRDGIDRVKSTVLGPSGLTQLQDFLKDNPQATEENFAKAKELLAKVDKKDIAAAIEAIKTSWKDADKEKISALVTEIESSNGFTLARIETGLTQPQGQALFKMYKGLVKVYLKYTPEFANFSDEERETLSIVGWKLIIDELSFTGFLKSAMQANTPSVESEDDIIALGEKLFGDTPVEQTDTQGNQKAEILKSMKAGLDKVKGNIIALGKVETEQRKQIFSAPLVLAAVIKTGEYKDNQWDIKLSENRVIVPQLTQEEVATLKSGFLEKVVSDTNSTFKNNERVGKVVNLLEKVTGTKLEDWLQKIPLLGPILAALVTGLKRILGFKDDGSAEVAPAVDDSVKKSLEGLTKYIGNEEGKKVKNVNFLANLSEEKGKDFFKFLKDIKVDVTNENFWPLILSGKLANGQDGTTALNGDANLGKLQKFMTKSLESSTTPDECIAKLAKIRESEEFKETKTLAQVVEEAIGSGTSFPLKINFNHQETLISIEQNSDGVIVQIGNKKMKLSKVTMPLEGGGGFDVPVKITNISFASTGKLKLNYTNNGTANETILSGNGDILKILMDLFDTNAATYTSTPIEVTQTDTSGKQTKTPLSFNFTKVA